MKNPLLQKDSPKRVARGGSWNSSAGNTRVSYRDRNNASYRYYILGFRLFRTKERS